MCLIFDSGHLTELPSAEIADDSKSPSPIRFLNFPELTEFPEGNPVMGKEVLKSDQKILKYCISANNDIDPSLLKGVKPAFSFEDVFPKLAKTIKFRYIEPTKKEEGKAKKQKEEEDVADVRTGLDTFMWMGYIASLPAPQVFPNDPERKIWLQPTLKSGDPAESQVCQAINLSKVQVCPDSDPENLKDNNSLHFDFHRAHFGNARVHLAMHDYTVCALNGCL